MNKNSRSNKSGSYWIYGKHAAMAAISNLDREIIKIVIDDKRKNEYLAVPGVNDHKKLLQIVPSAEFPKHTGLASKNDAGSQGIAVLVESLDGITLEVLLKKANEAESMVVVALDQVTDPHNFGAILRSCAAFNVEYVIIPKNNSVSESQTVAKAASGALDLVKLVHVPNLNQALSRLSEQNFWVMGLDGSSEMGLDDAKKYEKKVLVLGSEGEGMRRLTKEVCDLMIKIPISSQMESLNVSNAAAIALFELTRN